MPKLRPQVARDSGAQQGWVVVEVLAAAHSGDQPGDLWVGKRNLDSGGPERDAVAVTGRGQPAGSFEGFCGSAAIVVAAAGFRVGQDAGVHDTTHQDRDSACLAEGQQLDQGLLIEQRVATGHEERIEVALPGETSEHPGPVHADANGADDSFLAKPVQGRGGLADRRAPMLVGIVDEEQIDPVHAQSLKALVHGAAHAIGAVVEDHRPASRFGKVGVVDAGNRLAVDIGPWWDRLDRLDQATHLGRKDVIVPPAAGQARTESPFAGAIAVQWCGVEHPDPDLPGVLDDVDRVVFPYRREQAGDRPSSKAEPRDRQTGPPQWHPFKGFVWHPLSVDGRPGSGGRLTTQASLSYRSVRRPRVSILNSTRASPCPAWSHAPDLVSPAGWWRGARRHGRRSLDVRGRAPPRGPADHAGAR